VNQARRALRLGGAAVAVALVAAGAIGLRPQARPASVPADFVEIHSAHGASFVPALAGKQPLFILALGSDARPGQPIERERADSIHIIGIDTAHHRASILGFPRDSWVNIPGHGMSKINSAMSLGGPPLLISTLEAMTGIHIDLWLLTSFRGLIRMVNGIGGVTVDVPQRLDDHFSGAHLSKGTHHIQGKQALAFSRDRHDFLNGDLSRSANQGRVLIGGLKQLHATFDDTPFKIFDWIGLGWRNLHTDLSVGTLLDLALTATQIPASKVANQVVPATVGSVGSQSVVFITSGAQSVYADMRDDGVIG
jgi:LCP family protein required for cell wall assembly